jgi:Zinc finger, C3HC4 type (RING finger)
MSRSQASSLGALWGVESPTLSSFLPGRINSNINIFDDDYHNWDLSEATDEDDDFRRAVDESLQMAGRDRTVRPSAKRLAAAKNSDLDGDAEPTDDKDKQCIVCWENKKNIVFLQCGHMCACVMCARKIVADMKTGRGLCPFCREPIEQAKRVYY